MKINQDLKDLKDKIIEKSEILSNELIVKERSKIWQKLKEIKEEIRNSLPKNKIKITLKGGKEVDGISNVTTPYIIAQKHLKKSLLKEILVAKVTYLNKVSNIKITSLEDSEQEENCPNKEKENFE